jgi:hypothetical protein
LAYQVNDAGSAAPQWRDVALATGDVVIEPRTLTRVRVQQDRGTMAYTRRRMQDLETFRATLEVETGESSAP